MTALIQSPVLALPNPNGRLTFDTNVCYVHIGHVMLQKQQGSTTNPIGYWSHSIDDAERKYNTTQEECLPIVWAVQLLRPCFKGNRITIRIDHDSLK